jgi:hypothetical protein
MVKKTPAEIGAEIKRYFPHFGGGQKFNKTFAAKDDGASVYLSKNEGGSDMFNDFCQIGALLTDRNRCLYHLEALSFELEREVDRQIQSHDVASHRADPRVRLTPGDAAKLKAQVVSKDTVGKPNVADRPFDASQTPKFQMARREQNCVSTIFRRSAPRMQFKGIVGEV